MLEVVESCIVIYIYIQYIEATLKGRGGKVSVSNWILTGC